MHARQAALLTQATEVAKDLAPKTAATPVLWQYTDPEGKDFFLPERMMTVRSPYSGKSFSAHPVKHTMSDVGKELKEDAAAAKVAGCGEVGEECPNAGACHEAVAPPGWEDTVVKMKEHPEIDNPWALAWHMENEGMTPHYAATLSKADLVHLAKKASGV